MISLRLLGPVELTVDGGAPPAELLWKKNLALLVYLALSPRQTRTREHLTGLLWGDKPESAARHSLNEALRVLRKAVGDAALVTDATSVKLEAGTVSLDLDDFARHEAASEWRQAGALVGGAPLEGFAVPGESAFEDWLTAERSHWERRSVTALAQAAERSLSIGNTTDGVALAERAMSMAPTSNQAAAVLLKALALSGDRAAALARYDEYVRALRERLGVEPEAALSALADRIRKDRLGPAPGSEAAVQLQGEQCVGGLGLAVGVPVEVLVLARVVGVVPADAALAVPGRAQHHHPRRSGGGQLVGQQHREQEVAQVVGPELHLETVDGAAQRAGHDTGIVDH